ncbi:hypothetical protein AJ79_08541 [Helicocarpus griseus UAMH5409]|uniref:V-SNARE coiled-coil homology domain-containing protein n=1 Tax=Helicocarpus griseus UAMH5409 TaxID=1447875 RepID=A0A2B7WRN8_9EURO|nr:hypothetical protein AJ79_08541 [Helicocarpus griseus UAMH5409]
MADREQPYDPYIPSGSSQPAGHSGNGGNQRTAALQAVGLSSSLPPLNRSSQHLQSTVAAALPAESWHAFTLPLYSRETQIDDTVGVMRENINKVSQRGENLDSLQDKTDNLAVSAQGFRRGANRVRKQMWWKDFKMRICIIVGIIILLVVIIVPSGM